MNFSLKWKFDRRAIVAAAERAAAAQALRDSADHLLETTNRTIPIEEHLLEESGDVDVQGDKATVSYDKPYARKQHEDLDLKHDPGRRAKFLEKTMQEEEAAIQERLQKGIGKVFKK